MKAEMNGKRREEALVLIDLLVIQSAEYHLLSWFVEN